MTIRTLAEVGVCLEEAVSALPGEPASATDLFDRYEMIAIQILDCEHLDFPTGQLEDYLKTYLHLKRLELGLPDFME